MFEKTAGSRAVVLFFGVAAFLLSCASLTADTAKTKLAVVNLGEGRIQIEQAGHKRVVDLAMDIAGCTAKLYDPSDNEKYDSEVRFEVVDEQEKAPYTYVLLLSSASPNCNVQGVCGAAEQSSTLVWLKLDKDLKLAEKQAFAIIDCRTNQYAKIPARESSEEAALDLHAKDLPWSGDSLQLDFEMDETAEKPVRRLIYDRKKPEAGLQRIR